MDTILPTFSSRLKKAAKRGAVSPEVRAAHVQRLAPIWLEASVRDAEGRPVAFAHEGAGVTSWAAFLDEADATVAQLYKADIVEEAKKLLGPDSGAFVYDGGTTLSLRPWQEKKEK